MPQNELKLHLIQHCLIATESDFFFSQNGFDYLLTYSDDPQTVFPRYCVSWMVSSGELLSLAETCKFSVFACHHIQVF